MKIVIDFDNQETLKKFFELYEADKELKENLDRSKFDVTPLPNDGARVTIDLGEESGLMHKTLLAISEKAGNKKQQSIILDNPGHFTKMYHSYIKTSVPLGSEQSHHASSNDTKKPAVTKSQV